MSQFSCRDLSTTAALHNISNRPIGHGCVCPMMMHFSSHGTLSCPLQNETNNASEVALDLACVSQRNYKLTYMVASLNSPNRKYSKY